MLAVAALAILQGGFASPVAVCLCCAFIVAIDPWRFCRPGFGFLFLLSGALIVVAMTATGAGDFIFRLLRLQALAFFICMPLTMWFFGEASLVSPLANLIAVPVVGFSVLPLALADLFVREIICGVWRAIYWMVYGGIYLSG